MFCECCGASDTKYFFQEQCRRCIHLQSESVDDDQTLGDGTVHLSFQLTDYQQVISKRIEEHVQSGESLYLNAVCGAGKTEMCLEMIASSIASGKRVGWAIPRRQVVIELRERLQNYFPELEVIGVYGGHTDILSGNLIVCTTHQLYRYPKFFDVLILDEPDAFPYFNNEMLEFIMKRSVKGSIVYLSATLDSIPGITQMSLDLRPSQQLLPVPKITFSRLIALHFLYKYRAERILIFVPTRKHAIQVSQLLRCNFITSQSDDKELVIERFRESGGFLVTTTVLERGVTFLDCFVLVLFADHRVFTRSSLIQIAGRVGRGMNPVKGEVLFLCNYQSEEVTQACLKISNHNRSAKSVLERGIKA